MTLRSVLAATGLLSTGFALPGQTVLQNEHTDIGIAYENNAWDLHIHDETHDVEYSPPSGPDGAILQVNAGAQTTISANPLFSFLGPAGSSVWILPQTQDPNLLFLGFGAEEVQSGLFVGDSVNMRLHSVSGPGEFTIFNFDTFGNPFAVMNTRDGLNAADSVAVPAGADAHLNFAFSQPGTYTVNFEASGTLTEGNIFTSSGPVAYTFQVVPEPGTWVLMLAGLGGLWLLARRARA